MGEGRNRGSRKKWEKEGREEEENKRRKEGKK